MTIIYTVKFEDADGHQVACETLREAREIAKGMNPMGPHDDGWITKHKIAKLPARQLSVALLNRKDWCEENIEVGK